MREETVLLTKHRSGVHWSDVTIQIKPLCVVPKDRRKKPKNGFAARTLDGRFIASHYPATAPEETMHLATGAVRALFPWCERIIFEVYA